MDKYVYSLRSPKVDTQELTERFARIAQDTQSVANIVNEHKQFVWRWRGFIAKAICLHQDEINVLVEAFGYLPPVFLELKIEVFPDA